MIEISHAAASEVKRLRLKQVSSSRGQLRLSVQARGCAGLSYHMEFEVEPEVTDRVIHCEDIDIVVDPQSLDYLKGLVIDYTEDLMGGAFRFHNPNALEVCNCGHSFKAHCETAPSEA
ncbi:HesB/IscA family protein [Lyngbya confervoides]|uniref:Iron-sulfur cluster assembly accessory protein n=1 Tax=Lyngbya confervoides BDU141951 TaxID=1574623 RepID=A0ABD4T6C3_9CYAN|nr:iron-sulfur cluster assembly accessory protein [Lyngbya confervoides]MCM1984321.1 iron-sulfur cluster assembly accessory protein [Lyngbya confervoides BDU141951]